MYCSYIDIHTLGQAKPPIHVILCCIVCTYFRLTLKKLYSCVAADTAAPFAAAVDGGVPAAAAYLIVMFELRSKVASHRSSSKGLLSPLGSSSSICFYSPTMFSAPSQLRLNKTRVDMPLLQQQTLGGAATAAANTGKRPQPSVSIGRGKVFAGCFGGHNLNLKF